MVELRGAALHKVWQVRRIELIDDAFDLKRRRAKNKVGVRELKLLERRHCVHGVTAGVVELRVDLMTAAAPMRVDIGDADLRAMQEPLSHKWLTSRHWKQLTDGDRPGAAAAGTAGGKEQGTENEERKECRITFAYVHRRNLPERRMERRTTKSRLGCVGCIRGARITASFLAQENSRKIKSAHLLGGAVHPVATGDQHIYPV